MVENTRDFLVADAYLEGSSSFGNFVSGTYTKTDPIAIQFNKGKIVNIYRAEYTYDKDEMAIWRANGSKSYNHPTPIGAELIPVQGTTCKIDVNNIDWSPNKSDASDIIFGRMNRR